MYNNECIGIIITTLNDEMISDRFVYDYIEKNNNYILCNKPVTTVLGSILCKDFNPKYNRILNGLFTHFYDSVEPLYLEDRLCTIASSIYSLKDLNEEPTCRMVILDDKYKDNLGLLLADVFRAVYSGVHSEGDVDFSFRYDKTFRDLDLALCYDIYCTAERHHLTDTLKPYTDKWFMECVKYKRS